MPAHNAKAIVQCQSEFDCQKRIGTKLAMVPDENNYPLKLESLSSRVRSTSDGLRVALEIVVTNPTTRRFGPFQMVVSPGMLRQGQPIAPPAALLVEVESLDAGATGVFYVEDVVLPLPEGGLFGCLDRDFGTGT